MTALGALKLPLLLLLVVPIAPILHYLVGGSPLLVFASGAVAIAVLADWIRRGTENVSSHVGSALGGLLSISLGSLAELILALFVLSSGHTAVVRAQITGSILGTSLLGLGIAIVAGTIGRDKLTFKRERAGLISSLLVLVMIALLLPAVFDFTLQHSGHADKVPFADEALSLCVAGVLLALYVGNMLYTLVTHRDVFSSGGEPESGEGAWPLLASLGVLGAATVLIALEAELVSGALEATSSSLGLSDAFLGVIVLALVGTASDLFAGAFFARQDRMGLVLSICIGSAIQVALVLAPLLVLISWFMGTPMTLVFSNPLDLFAIAGAALIVNSIASDGEVTWFEGVLLIGVYVLFGFGFYFVT